MWRMSFVIFLTSVLCLVTTSFSYKTNDFPTKRTTKPPSFLDENNPWVDSVFNTLTQDEKIAQLLMLPAYSNKGKSHEEHILSLIKNYKIGGLIFMQGGPHRQAVLLNKYQSNSELPLLISMDAEWSLSMRLDSTVLYPRQMMLGAIQDNELIYEMGAEFARQLKRVGVHVSFSPVCDVNNNPLNPVINDRSFGEDKYNVSIKSYYYMKGLQDNGVLACAKHFPGHGDTHVDSHKALPVINHSFQRLDTLELYPFQYLIDKGIASVMVSHLFVPAIDSSKNLPSSLSPKTINELLKTNMGFKGLVFTDALNMGGITGGFKAGEADVKALLAGNDILLFPNEVPLVIEKIKQAIENGEISQEEIDNRCKKVLMAKYWVGLNKIEEISLENLHSDLNNTEALLMKQKLIENSLTLVTNKNSLIPLQRLDTLKIASISFGSNNMSSFQNRLKYYAEVDEFNFETEIKKSGSQGFKAKLKKYNLLIVGIHNTNSLASRKFGISKQTTEFVDEICAENNVILDLFANPYALAYFKNAEKCAAIIVSYNDWTLTNDLSAQLIFGGIPALGRLPVSVGNKFSVNSGYDTKKIRLKYTSIPEEAGVDSGNLYKVDSMMNEAINAKAFPGGQIVAARNGIVFYIKSFGYHDYSNKVEVNDFDLYDLASVTKVVGSAPALMKLYDEKLFTLNDKLSKHIPILQNTKKADFEIFDILTHRAGFKSWEAFFKKTIKNDSIQNLIYSKEKAENYNTRVCEVFYILDSYRDTIFQDIINSPHNRYGRYVYSDMGFYFFPEMIKKFKGKSMDEYLYDEFYSRLGAWTLRYSPLEKFSKKNITPTEEDNVFRKEQLHGYVHDQGAAMLGGISGHAGLFASANDVAKVMEMFIEKGSYGNFDYINSETIDLFTKYQFDSLINRRGLIWDKPVPNDTTKGLGTGSSSNLAYGHSGYTGTMVWADPHYDFIYVFNSNRVYKDAENWKILKLNTRTIIEEIFYQAIIKKNPDLKYVKN